MTAIFCLTDYQILNSIGLISGIIGVIFIFIWGPPQPQLEEGVGFGLEDNSAIDESGKTVKEFNEEIRRKRCRHSVFSKLGLFLIFIGFVLQLWATLM